MKIKDFSIHQIGALFCMIIIAIWSSCVLWLTLTQPLGINFTEILFLGALLPVSIILIPLYARRTRWSYLNGILVFGGLWVGFLKSLLDRTYFFSSNLYNLAALSVLILALLGIYFSLRSLQELPRSSPGKSTVGVISLLAVSVIFAGLASASEGMINNFILRNVIHGVQSRTEEIEDLDKRIQALMAEGNLPSLAAAIVVDNRITWSGIYGENPDLDNLYDIGSITKPVIATAVLQLVEDGSIELEDDVNQHLPFSVRHPDDPDTPITVRHLLSHRSCLGHNTRTYYAYILGEPLKEWGVQHRGWEYRPELINLSYEEFMVGYLNPGGIYYQPANWTDCQPGSSYHYSSPGYDLLGYLIEQVSGKPLESYLEERIFHPLQMFNTTASVLEIPELAAVPYERWYGVLAKTNVQLPLSQRRRIGGGGLYSNISDLSHFLIAHMNQGKYGEIQILEPETVQLMHDMVSETGDDFMQVGYGLGWAIFQENPRQMWDITFHPRGFQGHGGRTWGYNGVMYMVEGSQGAYGFIALMNHSMVESIDQPWVFSIQFNIQELILSEAERLYQDLQ